MNSLSPQAIFCPTSFQIKLAISHQKSRFGFLRLGFPGLHRRNVDFVVVKGSEVDVEGIDRRATENSSWISLSSAADGFSGWGVERNGDVSKNKQSLVGILRAGIAGAFVFAGITFALVSLSSRTKIKAKESMLPLTELQEKSYSYIDDKDQIDGYNAVIPDSVSEEIEAGAAKVHSFHCENSMSSESSIGDDAGVRQSSENGDGSILTSFPNELSQSLVSSNRSDEAPIIYANHKLTTPSNTQSSNGGVSPGEPLAEEFSGFEHVNSSFLDDSLETPVIGLPNDVPKLNVNDNDNFSSNSSGVQPSVSDIVVKNDADILKSEPIEVVALDSGTVLSASDAELRKEYPNLLFTQRFTTKISAIEDGKSPLDQKFDGKVQESLYQSQNPSIENDYDDVSASQSFFDVTNLGTFSPSAGIPAPSTVPAALQAHPGKVLVPAVIDQLQSQALSALQVLKVIEDSVKPGDLCTRREYARWLVVASSVLSRSTTSKVYPAMYIENVSELAFDDITPADPDFPSIQGLAEAGLISSKLSRHDLQQNNHGDIRPFYFSPDSPLSRQDLVAWRMTLDKRQLPVVEKKTLQQLSGFIDIDKIDPDAWPALVADLAAGEQGIITLAFGYTRLFQPEKPVTKSQAAIALSTGDACATVSEELARIEAESIAENAVTAHNALLAQVENDLNESYEKELSLEREKINAVEKLAEEARREIEKLKAAKEEENLSLMKGRAAVDSEMEVLSRLNREVEEHLQSVMADKLEISYEKERLNKLRRDAEAENQEITRLQYELDVERKALSMARAWAEEEAKRAREQAKALDEARSRWESRGLKIVVDKDLSDEANAGVTWLTSGEDETIERSEKLVDKLNGMAHQVATKVKGTITRIVEIISSFISDVKKVVCELEEAAKLRWDSTLKDAQRDSSALSSAVKNGAKRIAGNWKEGVERLSQRFKT